MTCGEMRERIKLYKIKPPNGPHQIFNPTLDDVELVGEIWTKREDILQAERWGMVRTNVIDRKQFIIRHRKMNSNMAIGFDDKIYPIFGTPDLDNKKRWTMLLVGRLGSDGYVNDL